MPLSSQQKYGVIARIFHWFSAIAIVALFTFGLWMVDLDYYHSWYHDAPHYHRSFGLCLLAITLFRLLWRLLTTAPDANQQLSSTAKLSSVMMHCSLYVLMFVLFISGYLISTADERDIAVFNWFFLPAISPLVDSQEEIAGEIHEISAYLLLLLATLHALAALKHHFINKDNTLNRML